MKGLLRAKSVTKNTLALVDLEPIGRLRIADPITWRMNWHYRVQCHHRQGSTNHTLETSMSVSFSFDSAIFILINNLED